MLESLIIKLHERVPEMVRLTRELVEINSHTANVAGVNEVARRLEQVFRLPGLSLHREPAAADCGDHLFWSTESQPHRKTLLLIGHHDTVFPPGYFEGLRVEGGRAIGPGVLDLKSGLALLWGVSSTLAEAGLLGRCALTIACVADEETGSLDSKRHLEALARGAEGALVFEAGRPGDAIITRRRGIGTIRAMAHGKAAHSGNDHRSGANAIWTLAKFVDQAQALTDYVRGTTVNVGLIRGGTSANTVPAQAEATLDLRFDSVDDAEALIANLHRAAEASALEGTMLELHGGIKRLPMERTPESVALYQAYARCQREAGLGGDEHPLVGGGSDANTVAGVGVPAIDGLGLRGAGFHTTSEYIELDSFGPKAEALLRFLWRRLGERG